jgi:photosystem II stability/assembly factor-like uncharacterized protein
LLPGLASAGWVQQQSGTTASLRSIYFINAQTGWVAGDANGDPHFILRTTNGGANWVRYSVDTLRIGSDVIRFWDSQLGFVGSGVRLYKSTDGGLTWRYIPTRFWIPHIFNIAFVTPLKGWLVNTWFYSGDGGAGDLYQTIDGGETWVKRDSSGSYLFRDVAFADSLFGCFTADNHGWSYPSNGFVKQTTDGGSAWQTVASGWAYGPFRFLGRNFAWRSWFYRYPYNPESWRWGIQKTTDQGAHWTEIYSFSTEGYCCSCIWDPRIALVDYQKGWFLFRDTLRCTRDGGATWSWQIPGQYLNDLFFSDSLNGWLVGRYGLILHTTDGGSGVFQEGVPSPIPRFPSSIRPNPFTSFATLPGHEAERFSLYDVSGRKVGTYRGDRVGEGLAPGVYFVCQGTACRAPTRIVKVR